ncbi:MAG: polysaccharide pyruvyl transferase family protein [Gemmatimonadaceae bacterium]
MTKIILTGTYSSFNRGDAAMQSCMARELRAALPGADIVIHTPFPADDRRYYTDARVIASSRRNLVGASLKLAWLWIRRLLGARGSTLLPGTELRELASSDLVIDLSGDMLTEEHGLHLAWSHFLPLMMALALGRPLYVCAQSIGPFRLSRAGVRRVMRAAAAVSAREQVTMEYLEARLGLDMRRVQLTADLAFLLEPAAPARVDEILREEGLPGATGFLGVSVSAIVAASHARHNAGVGTTFAGLMAAVLDAAQEHTGARIVFISHVTGPRPAKDDRRISAEVWQRMQRREHAVVLQGDYRSEELKGIIARSAAFMGARMHANIAALSSAVPVLAISYSHKTLGIMRLLGVGEWVADSRSLTVDALRGRLDDLWAQREALSSHLRSRLGATREASRRNVAIALELLHNAAEVTNHG